MLNTIIIKDVATFDSTGVVIDKLNKFNFIYGSNGTGKTTISNFLKYPNNIDYISCSKTFRSNQKYEILVYNKKFKEEHFKENDIPGVFTVGKESIEEQDKIIELNNNLKLLNIDIVDLNKDYDKIIKAKQTIESNFETYVWDKIRKPYSMVNQSAFEGFKGSRAIFAKEIQRRNKLILKSIEIADEKEILEEYNRLYGIETHDLEHIIIRDSDIKTMLTIENDDIWNTPIVGSKEIDISNLIEKFNNSDWVSQGRSYISEEGICPFCQKETISQDFLIQLEQYFNKEYDLKINKINILRENYNKSYDYILYSIESLLENEILNKLFNIKESELNNMLSTFNKNFKNTIELIDRKIDEPAIKLSLSSNKQFFDDLLEIINKLNLDIGNQNLVFKNIKSEREKYQNNFWDFCILKERTQINSFTKDISTKNKEIQEIENEISKLNEKQKNIVKIKNSIESSQTNVKSSIDSINKSLKAFSFESFEIVPSPERENSYQIKRPNGQIATDTLSEGEETFISFLYFMELVKGSLKPEEAHVQKIIVLDDPISSLDSTIIYIVSAMIKNMMKNIEKPPINNDYENIIQVIILTHNVYFHKEVSNIYPRDIKRKRISYWVVNKDNEISNITEYGNENPISSSYELLWNELGNDDNKSLITIQNIMRRILETYFGVLGHYKNDIKLKFETVEEQRIFESLIDWLNDGSHTVYEDLYIEHSATSTDKYKKVFKDVFDKTGNQAHYKMMMTKKIK